MERGGSDECTVNLKFISYYCHELSAQTLPFFTFHNGLCREALLERASGTLKGEDFTT